MYSSFHLKLSIYFKEKANFSWKEINNEFPTKYTPSNHHPRLWRCLEEPTVTSPWSLWVFLRTGHPLGRDYSVTGEKSPWTYFCLASNRLTFTFTNLGPGANDLTADICLSLRLSCAWSFFLFLCIPFWTAPVWNCKIAMSINKNNQAELETMTPYSSSITPSNQTWPTTTLNENTNMKTTQILHLQMNAYDHGLIQIDLS